MRIVARREWTPRGGHVIDWVADEHTVAAATIAAAGEPHPVGPSFLQRDHITAVAATRASGRTHRAYTCAAVTVAGTLDEPRMTLALNGFLRDHHGLRSTFRTSGNEITRHVVDAQDIALRAHHRDIADHEIAGHVDMRLSSEAVFDSFPGVIFGAIVRDDSSDLYFGIDHAFGDGSSQVIGLAEILARYGGQDVPVAGSHIDYVAAEFAAATQVRPTSPELDEWVEALRPTGGRLPAFALDLGLDDGEPQPVRIRRAQLADADDAEAIAHAASAAGTGFTAAVYAALAVTDRHLSGRDSYCTATVLSTRSAEHTSSQGWYCTFAPVAFDVRGADAVDVLADAADGLARARRLARTPAHAALRHLIAARRLDPAVLASPQMVSYLDFRWFPGQRELADAVLFTGEGRTRNASLWISRDHDGLWIATQCPDNPVARESVTRYFDTLRATLATMVTSPMSARTSSAPALGIGA